MAVFNVLPVGVLIVCALATKIFWFGAWLVLGVSGPMYLCVMMYDKIFERIEETVE